MTVASDMYRYTLSGAVLSFLALLSLWCSEVSVKALPEVSAKTRTIAVAVFGLLAISAALGLGAANVNQIFKVPSSRGDMGAFFDKLKGLSAAALAAIAVAWLLMLGTLYAGEGSPHHLKLVAATGFFTVAGGTFFAAIPTEIILGFDPEGHHA